MTKTMTKGKTKRTKHRTEGDSPNYVIIGKGEAVAVVSGKTGESFNLGKQDDVLKLVRERQELGKKLTKLLQGEKFKLVLSDKGSVVHPHFEED